MFAIGLNSRVRVWTGYESGDTAYELLDGLLTEGMARLALMVNGIRLKPNQLIKRLGLCQLHHYRMLGLGRRSSQ